jgi:hypothetical protein
MPGTETLETLRMKQGLPPLALAEDPTVKLLTQWLSAMLEGWSSVRIRKVRSRCLEKGRKWEKSFSVRDL